MINILGLADLDKDPEAVAKTLVPGVVASTCRAPRATLRQDGLPQGAQDRPHYDCGPERRRGALAPAHRRGGLDRATQLAEDGGKLPAELTLAGIVAQNASASAPRRRHPRAAAFRPSRPRTFRTRSRWWVSSWGSDSDLR